MQAQSKNSQKKTISNSHYIKPLSHISSAINKQFTTCGFAAERGAEDGAVAK